LHVIAAERDAQAVGFGLADERAVISTEDEPALERLARAREIDGVVSPGADWTVGVAARIAERMGLPHPLDAATAGAVTSKNRQRAAFSADGVPQPRIVAAGSEPPVPCVVKAPDRQGQRGLTVVRERSQLDRAIAEATEASRTGSYLIEELVDGPEVTVIAISVAGTFLPLAVNDRLTAAPPAFGVALAHVWPSSHATEAAVAAARAAAASLGVRNGPTYTQVRLGTSGPAVIELAARLGGGHDAELVEAATGVQLNELAIRFALGEDVDLDASNTLVQGRGRVGGGCVAFLVPPEGVLRDVEGVDDAAAIDGVRWARTYRRPGWRFGPFRRGADRAGAVLAVGSSAEQALERGRRAAEAVRFLVDADST
jgi:biotin carboxylase